MSILRFVSIVTERADVSLLTPVILCKVDPTQGKIVIDGLDITKIGVHDLRSRLVSRCLLLFRDVSPHLSFLDVHPTRRGAFLRDITRKP